MDTVIDNENLTDNQKEKYRSILKKQYQDLKYDVVSEKYDGDNATVEVKIKVYDLYNNALDMIEKATFVSLDTETFYPEYVSETLEEVEARLGSNYKYIKGAYTRKCDEFKKTFSAAFVSVCEFDCDYDLCKLGHYHAWIL